MQRFLHRIQPGAGNSCHHHSLERIAGLHTIILRASDSTFAGEVRRAAMRIAREEELGENLTSDVGIVATELSTNLVKHAQHGEIHVASMSERGERGLEILSIDRGPGFDDLARKLRDGYSTAGSSGTGLGAILRRSTDFDVYSEPRRGTVLVSRICVRVDADRPETMVGIVSKPVPPEPISGDAWAVSLRESGCVVMLADGLGHGENAAKASRQAVTTFRQARDGTPVPLLQSIHAALRGTRGAAISIADLSWKEERIRFAGIGNVAGRVVAWNLSQHMVSHVGTAGFEARRFQEFTYSLPNSAALVMHSDGLTSSWNLAEYPGLLERDPSLIAAVLYRDASRGRDDVCVVVAKRRKAI